MTVKERLSPFWQKISAWVARQLNDQHTRKTIASLDGVRALAFLLVFALHINHSGVWGDEGSPLIAAFYAVGGTGVTLFFILSGFLLFLPYAQALLFGKSWPQAKVYYIRRILRIFPGYFFSLFILVMFTRSDFIQPHNWGQLVPFLTFTMGFYNSSELINGPYWTLAVEFQYYLLLPLIAAGILGLARLVRSERRLKVVVGALLAVIIWGLLTSWLGAYFTRQRDQTLLVPRPVLDAVLFVIYGDHSKFLEDFAVGMLIAVSYLVLRNTPRSELPLRWIQRILPWLWPLFLALYVYASLPTDLWPFLPHVFSALPWLNEFAFALCYSYLVVTVLFSSPENWLVRLFSWTPLRWLGLISYSMYLWHRPLIQILAANLGPDLQLLFPPLMVVTFWAICLTVSGVFCFFLFVFIERPGMRLSERFRPSPSRQEVPSLSESEPSRPQDRLDTMAS